MAISPGKHSFKALLCSHKHSPTGTLILGRYSVPPKEWHNNQSPLNPSSTFYCKHHECFAYMRLCTCVVPSEGKRSRTPWSYRLTGIRVGSEEPCKCNLGLLEE